MCYNTRKEISMSEKEQICKNCGEVATPVKIKPGAVGLEIALWLLGLVTGFLLPVAIIYSIWRVCASKGNCCPKCRQQNTMIPVDSAIGKKLITEFHSDELKTDVNSPQDCNHNSQDVNDKEQEIGIVDGMTKEEIVTTLSAIKGYDHVNWVVLKNTLPSPSKATKMLAFLQQEYFIQGSAEDGYVPNVEKIEQYLSNSKLDQKNYGSNEIKSHIINQQRKQHSQNANKQESVILKVGKIFLGIFIAGLFLRAILAENKQSQRKYPVLTTLQNWEVKPSNATLKSLVNCKEETLFYTLKDNDIMLAKYSCNMDKESMAFFMTEQSRNSIRKQSKEVFKVGSTEVTIGKTKNEGKGKLSTDAFIYRSTDYLTLMCTGPRGIEKICKDVAVEIANQAELF